MKGKFWVISLVILLSFSFLEIKAEIEDPVNFKVSLEHLSALELEVNFSSTIDKGWHVYSIELPSGGPISASLTLEESQGVEEIGKLFFEGIEIKKYDKLFLMNLRYFENEVTFCQKFKIIDKQYHLKGYLEYGACNDVNCLPPTTVDFDFTGEGIKEEKESIIEEPLKKDTILKDTLSITTLKNDTLSIDTLEETLSFKDDIYKPVIEELQKFNGNNEKKNISWIYIFLMGFLGGIIALFTPCVWPIIPMTVSFFLKRSQDKNKGIKDAITYGISIIIIYVALGLIITAIFGASSLNSLSTNAVFNIFFFLLLVVFAFSFFGWFEIRLPSSWGSKVDKKASLTGGLLGIFFMAFTLALISFSCTGPIIGFLLVEVSSLGNFTSPAIGMLGFAIALALPFTLFAMFPTWLKQMPKSGSWMNTIKIVLGFIELAFSLKFLSVADLAYGWGILNREVFLILWIIIFLLLGLYLIGKLKFKSDLGSNKSKSIPCIILGIICFAFTIYLIPGLWGAPCKAVSAFLPPMYTQTFNIYHNEVKPRSLDYEQGLLMAKKEHKPVLIDFTGYGCVNCRKMESAVWMDSKVAKKLNSDFVLISLYVDDKTPLDTPRKVSENKKERTLRTIGDKWSYLQRMKFGANAQPFYVIVDENGNPLSKSYGYDENISHFLDFLNNGIKSYNK